MKLIMPLRKKSQKSRSTKADFRNSWQMLRENYKAFIFTEIFAICAFLLSLLFLSFLLYIIVLIIPDYSMEDFVSLLRNQYTISILFRVGFTLLTSILLLGFMNCQFGLANDIMNSGEMFAEFKGSFAYFKKNWGQFFVLTIIMSGFFFIMSGPLSGNPTGHPYSQDFSVGQMGIFILRTTLYFFWFLLFIHAYPSVVLKNNLWLAIKESVHIFVTDFRRIFRTWSIFFISFWLPPMILGIFGVIFFSGSTIVPKFPIFAIIIILIIILIAFPLSTLLATGIYNNSSIFAKSPNLKEKSEKRDRSEEPVKSEIADKSEIPEVPENTEQLETKLSK